MITALAGKMPPEPNSWITVPGTQAVQIYPLIRKPSVTCSNTYIIKSPRFLIIIDPGADIAQIEQVRQVVLSAQGKRPLPVFIFLTHCHIDHFLAVHLLMDQALNGQLICHPLAAAAIENRDESITLANMNGSVLPVCQVRDRLVPPAKTGLAATEHPLVLESGIMEFEDGQVLPFYVIPLSDKDRMEVYPTPGHSPDSVCYQIGNFLCTGDLHLATTPGIAGKAGWDNNKLAVSLQAVLAKGKKDAITHVFPGHGNVLSFDKAARIFTTACQDALQLTGLALFDRERSLYVSEHAIVLLEEASSIFSIVAARLLKVSYYMEMLDENESAAAILAAIDSDTIDKIVEEFQDFIAELKGKRGAPVIAKAVQFARKVNQLFEPEKIAALFDPSFLRRIKNLLADFVNVVYGIRFADQETIFNLSQAVEETLASLQENPSDAEKIFETLDDDREFVDELTRRIAVAPLFSATEFTFRPASGPLFVTADKLMFQDLLAALLEQFAISEIRQIALQTDCGRETATLSVAPGPGAKTFVLRDSKALYLQHSLRRSGGEFQKIVASQTETYRFSFSRITKNSGGE